MGQISDEKINDIVSRFPCLSKGTNEDWNTDELQRANV